MSHNKKARLLNRIKENQRNALTATEALAGTILDQAISSAKSGCTTYGMTCLSTGKDTKVVAEYQTQTQEDGSMTVDIWMM